MCHFRLNPKISVKRTCTLSKKLVEGLSVFLEEYVYLRTLKYFVNLFITLSKKEGEVRCEPDT